MKISYNWLKDYIDTTLPAEKLAEILTDIGLEVEALAKVEAIRGGLSGIVVGEVLTCTKHPDADKLKITTVDVGSGEPLQIVCGAPNVAAGQKVLVATVGSTLYPTGEENGFKIKRSKIRGVESLGMICAEDEIGIGTDHDGIMVLPETTPIGTESRHYFQLQDDYIFEIGLTPNRADAACHFGVARDIAAYLKSHELPVTLGLPSTSDFKQDNEDKAIKVEVLNHEAAPRYMGLTMTGIQIAPSPEWLQLKLRSIGITPKNNVVDITNFVLHETGQPLHAFDAARIAGGKVVVRTCAEGTLFTTLDGVERKLSSHDLMICDDEKPMCIAGVFGGLKSGVTEQTTEIFLESAYFNPVWVRKSARRHGLNTDASFRFERGVDPNITRYSLYRAALLIRELAGGRVSSPVTDIYPVPIEPFRFDVSLDRVRMLIGKNIPDETIIRIIDALEIHVEHQWDDSLTVVVPPYRVDVQREADLIEDILRLYGYNHIELPDHLHSSIAYAPVPDRDKLMHMVADMLTANGYHEIMSNSLTKSAYYDNLTAFPPERAVKILNPLSNDLNVMRQTLLFSALEAVELNVNRRNADLKLYEFGNCYQYLPEKAAEGGLAPYREEWRLGMLVTGLAECPAWNRTAQSVTFYTLKGMFEKVLKRFGLEMDNFKLDSGNHDLYSESLSCTIDGIKLFELGIVAPKLLKRFGIKQEVYFGEANFDQLVSMTKKHKISVQELSKFPEVKRDLALLIDKSVNFAQLRKIAFATERRLLKNVSLFDVYEGDKLPVGKKSYALSFILEDKSKTLTDHVIDKTMNNLIRAYQEQLGAQIR